MQRYARSGACCVFSLGDCTLLSPKLHRRDFAQDLKCLVDTIALRGSKASHQAWLGCGESNMFPMLVALPYNAERPGERCCWDTSLRSLSRNRKTGTVMQCTIYTIYVHQYWVILIFLHFDVASAGNRVDKRLQCVPPVVEAMIARIIFRCHW